MITEQQRAERSQGIGGSDAGIILGLSPYKTPLQLWLEKTGQAEPPDLADSEPIQWGNRLEAIVARAFTEQTGLRLAQVNKTLVSKQYPFMRGNIDRRIVGQNAIVEIKTVGSLSDEPRPDHVAQLLHYMAIPQAVSGWLVYLIGGQRLVTFHIQATDYTAPTRQLIEAEAAFWDCVQNRTPPAPRSITDLRLLFPDSTSSTVTASAELEQAALELHRLTAEKKALESAIEERQGRIMRALEQADTLTDSQGRTLATWKSQTAHRLDGKALKAEHPELAARYTTATSSRVFRLKGAAHG